MQESDDLSKTAMLKSEFGDDPTIALAQRPRETSRTRLSAILPRTKALFAFALALQLASFLGQHYLAANETVADKNVDFYVYYFAAQLVHDNPHANLYAGATEENPQTRYAATDNALAEHARAAGFNAAMFYLYPPLLADLFVPLSRASTHLAPFLWRIFNLGLVLASVLLLARMLRIPFVSFECAVLIMAAYAFFPVGEAIFLGQITIVMLALWSVGIVAYSKNRMILSAAAFAFATAFKVTPIMLIPLFFIWKDRRWLVSYFVISLGLLATMIGLNGLQNVITYPSVMSAMGNGIPFVYNKTITSLISWVYYGRLFTSGTNLDSISRPPHFLSIITKTLSGFFYLSCLFLVWRNRHLQHASRTVTIAIFALVTACVSPVSWRHGYTVAFIVFAIFWVKALRTYTRPLQTVLLTLSTLTIGCLFCDLAAGINLPQFCRIILASSGVLSIVLFSLDALYHADVDAPEPSTA